MGLAFKGLGLSGPIHFFFGVGLQKIEARVGVPALNPKPYTAGSLNPKTCTRKRAKSACTDSCFRVATEHNCFALDMTLQDFRVRT